GDGGQPDHRRGPLEAVGGAEGPVEVRAVSLLALQLDQPFFQADEELARFLVEHHPEAIIASQVSTLSSVLSSPTDSSSRGDVRRVACSPGGATVRSPGLQPREKQRHEEITL